MNATNKAFTEMQVRKQQGTLGRKNQPDEIITNYGKSEKTIPDNKETSGSNDFLRSDRGLFSSRETQQQNNDNSGGAARRLRQRNQENIYGVKSDMKRYGTMEKLDVSDLVYTEQEPSDSDSEEWENPLHFNPDDRDRTNGSPDVFDNEDIEHFMDHFRSRKNESMQRKQALGKTTSQNNTLERRKKRSEDRRAKSPSAFVENYLTEKDEKRSGSFSSIEGWLYRILFILTEIVSVYLLTISL